MRKEYDNDFKMLSNDIKKMEEYFDKHGPKLHGSDKLYASALQKFTVQASQQIIKNLQKSFNNQQ